MGKRKDGAGRLANPLVALSSAAVLAIYSAGYVRTRAAAEQFQVADRSRIILPAAPSPDAERREPPAAVSTAPIPSAAATPTALSLSAPARSHKAVAVGVGGKPATVTALTASPVATETPVAAPPVAATPVAATPVATTPVSTPAVAPEPTPTPAPKSQYRDGTYSGWGTSRHGDIEATVVIAGGKITSAQITQCLTRYSCSLVAHLQGQVVARQSPDVDYVSGATQSTNAFYYAVVEALSKAK